MNESEMVLRFRSRDDDVLTASLAGSWAFPVPGADLAIMPLAPPGVHMISHPMDATTEAAGWNPIVGDEIQMIGLLLQRPGGSEIGLQILSDYAVPMLRSATLGAASIPLRHGQGKAYSMVGHLLDTRSERGASGSPVFAVSRVADLNLPVQKLPTGIDDARSMDLRNVRRFRFLYGMLVAYKEEERVGLVLPVESIRQGLDRVDRTVDGSEDPYEPLLNASVGGLHVTIDSWEPLDDRVGTEEE